VSEAWVEYILRDPTKSKERYQQYKLKKDEFEVKQQNLAGLIRRTGKNKKSLKNDTLLATLTAEKEAMTIDPPEDSDREAEVRAQQQKEKEFNKMLARDSAANRKRWEEKREELQKAQNLKRAKEISNLVAERFRQLSAESDSDSSSDSESSDSEPVSVFSVCSF
jgi:hypothetical protein